MEEIAYGPSAWPRGEHGLGLGLGPSARLESLDAPGFGTTFGALGNAGTFSRCLVVQTHPPLQRSLP